MKLCHFIFIGKLPACSIDVLPSRLPYLGDDALAFQYADVHVYGLLGRLSEFPFIDGIVLNQVDFRWDDLAKFGKGFGMPLVVVDSFPDHVFVGDFSLGAAVPKG